MLTVHNMTNMRGKKVIVRVDFNVPLKDGTIRDDNRIVAALETIRDLLKKEARVILLSHLGKIKHKETPEVIEEQKKKNDLTPVAVRLGELLNMPIKFSKATSGPELNKEVEQLKDSEVLLVQNTRYEKGEEKNDPELSKKWAGFADAFVMDAFGSAHRAHASTYGVPELLKAEGKPVAVGYLVEKEVENLTRCVEARKEDRPYIAILGGLKVSDKIKVIDTLLKKCDKILIGGAMAYTFAKALGHTIGISPVEEDQIEYARRCLVEAKGRIILPLDSVCTDAFDPNLRQSIITTETQNIPENMEGMDIGPKTQALFAQEISKAQMVFWNGPMGVFEQPEFTKGTIAICKAISQLKGAFTVCGGGDSAAAVKQFGFSDKFSHVSTGGGASLEMIENEGHLPGIDIIR